MHKWTDQMRAQIASQWRHGRTAMAMTFRNGLIEGPALMGSGALLVGQCILMIAIFCVAIPMIPFTAAVSVARRRRKQAALRGEEEQ